MVFIKKITIDNFKSFPKKTTIPLSKGFTAITGPNGSGKSNIIDALCFVLGKSSARSMRAYRLSELIYHGNGNTSAYVSIHLDNSEKSIPIDSNEVVISRKVDPDGKTTYYLNQKRVTRSEVIDFLSSALLHPDGHNIILQGDVNRVIEMSPVERRKIIDEVAGIAEYDEKKEKAIKELEKVEENLKQVEIVLKEVQNLLEKLKEEREEALRYKGLLKDLERKTASLYYSRLCNENESLSRIKNKITRLNERKNSISDEIKKINSYEEEKLKDLEEIRNKIAEITEKDRIDLFKNIEDIKGKISHISILIDQKNREIVSKENEISHLDSRINECLNSIKNTETLIENYREKEKDLNEKISEKEFQIKSINEKISEKEARDLEIKREIFSINKELEQKIERRYIIEKDLDRLKSALERNENELESYLKQRESEEKTFRELEDKILKIKSRTEKEKEEFKRIAHEIESLINKDKEIKREILRVEKELSNLYVDFNRINSKIKEEEKLKGYSKPVKEILRLRDENKIEGVYGTIGELIEVDPKYEIAVDVAGRGRLNFIVVRDENIAEKAIKHLKENKIGRATFLPLNKMKKRKFFEISEEGSYGFIVDLIKYDKRFEDAIWYVFGDTILIENLAVAKKIGIGKFRMVTLDGDLIEKGGAMTGGFYEGKKLSKEKIDLKRILEKIDELKVYKDKLEKDKEILLENISDLERKRNDLENKRLKGELEEEETRTRLEGLEYKIKKTDDRVLQTKDLIERVKREIENKEVILSDLNAEIEELEKRKNELESEPLFVNENLFNEVKILEQELIELKNQKMDVVTKLESEKSKLNILNQRFLELESKKKSIHEEITNLREELSDASNELLIHQNRLKEMEEIENKILEGLKDLKEKRDLIKSKLTEYRELKNRMNDEIESIDQEISQLNTNKAKIEAKIENLSNQLEKIKYEGNPERSSIKELEEEIAKIEHEISMMSDINLKSIEDFEKTSERNRKLIEQKQKLEEEKGAILNFMDEIEKKKLEVFMDAYNAISKNFEEIFSFLLSGGEARLSLEDPSNPLESGLLLHASPKDKQLKRIEALSGGEKTLTALSFLFSVLKYRPAPFYALDEIDMFLDDENVEKIASLIQKYSKEGQFVVVSLRKPMIKLADQLLGVTQQKGVSKVVAIELDGR